MFKRLFFAAIGLGAGVTLGIWAVRKVEETQAKLSPEHLGRVTAARAGNLRGRLAEAVEEGRRAAAEKESELRAVYRVHEPAQAAAPPQAPVPPPTI